MHGLLLGSMTLAIVCVVFAVPSTAAVYSNGLRVSASDSGFLYASRTTTTLVSAEFSSPHEWRWSAFDNEKNLSRSTLSGDVSESVAAVRAGLEHIVTIHHPPYPLHLSISLTPVSPLPQWSKLVATPRGVALIDTRTGETTFSYEDLVILTADAEVVPAALVPAQDGSFSVGVACPTCADLPASAYPLTVDPLTSSTDFYYFTGDGVAGWPDGDGQLFGFDVEVGDFDGDSLLDIAIGAPSYETSPGSNNRKGAVFIYRGITSTTWDDQANRLVFSSPSAGAIEGFMGCSIAKGQFNGGAGMDLVVGAYRETGGGFPNPDGDGTVGSANALRGAFYTITDANNMKGPQNFPGLPRRYGGWRVLAADILIEESVDSPIISIPYDNIDNQGQGYIAVVNRINNLAITELVNPRYSLTDARSNDGFFGTELGVGDFNNDGDLDLVVSATRSWENKVYQGVISIWYGPISEDELANDYPDVRGGIEYLYGQQIGVAFGWAVAAGDVNNDGVDDLIVGSPWASFDKADQGRVDVYYGAAAPGRISTGASPDWSYFGESQDELFGFEIEATGDLNRDGIADFIVSAPFFGNERGRVYSFHGKAGGLDQVQGASNGITTGPADYDLFGWSLASGGDFNGDGYNDAVVGGWSHRESFGAQNGTVGRVWIIIGQPLADLDVTLTGPASVLVENQITYSVTVTNHGQEDDSVLFTLSMVPRTLLYVSSTTPCSQSCASCPVVCNLGALNNGASTSFDIVLDAEFEIGSYLATAEAVSNFVPARLDEDGAVDTVTTTVGADTDLIMAQFTATPTTVETGELLSLYFELYVDPGSPSASVNTILAVTGFPTDFALASVTTSGNVFGSLFVDFGNLVPGSRVNATAVVAIPSIPSTTSLALTATAQTDATDTVPANNVLGVVVPIIIVADLRVTVQSTPSSVIAGNQVGFSFILQNLGGSTADTAVLNFSLPTETAVGGFVLDTINDGGFACTVTNPGEVAGGGRTNYTCNIGTMLAFTTQVVTVFGSSPVNAPEGTFLTVTASTASLTLDDDTSNNDAALVVPIVTQADLNVFAFSSLSIGYSNDTVAWSAQVTNVGPSGAVASAVYVALPSQVDAGAFSITYSENFTDPTFVCSQMSSSTFKCEHGPASVMYPDEQFTFRVESVVQPSAPGIITMTASTNATTSDVRTADNTDSVSVSIVTGSDMWLGTLTPRPASACAGEFISYDFGIISLGPEDGANVVYNQTLPAGTVFVTASSECSLNPPSTLLCTWASIPAGQTRTGTVLLSIEPDNLGPLETTAVLTSTSPDYFIDNSVNSNSLAICTRSGLSLVMLGLPDEVAEVSSLFLALTVFNSGPSVSRGITITIDFPPGSDILSWPAGCTTVSGSVATGLSGLCNVADLSVGTRTQLDVRISVNATVGNITTNAVVASTTPDAFLGDNFASVVTNVVPGSIELALFGTNTDDPILAGVNSVQIYTIFNTGSLPATSTVLTIYTDTGAVSGLDSSAPAYCSYAAGSGIVTCNLPGEVAAFGGSASVTLPFTTVLSFVGSFDTMGNVASPVLEFETSNNNATVSQTIVRDSDAAILVTATPSTIYTEAPFDVTTFAVVINNLGPSLSPNAVLYMEFPPQLVVTSITPSVPAFHNCTTIATSLLECPLVPMARFDQVTLSVAAVLSGVSSPTSLSVTSNVTQIDSNPANNVIVSTINVASPYISLSVSGTSIPSTVSQLDSLNIAFSISNLGPFVARDVSFTFHLPPGFNYKSLSPFGGSCSLSSGVVGVSETVYGCTVGDLSPSVVSGIIEVDVNTTATGTVNSLLYVNTTTADVSGTANDVRIVPTTLVPVNADLALFITDLTGPADEVLAGSAHQAVFTIFNAGTAVATGVVLSVQTDPAFIVGFPAGSNPGSCSWDSGTGLITCGVPDIVQGGSAALTLSLTTSSLTSGVYSMTGNTSTPVLEYDFSNNEATETTTLVRASELSLDLFAAPSPVYVPNSLILSALVTNSGPSPTLDGDTVLDLFLPLEVMFQSLTVTGFGSGHACAYDLGAHAVQCNITALPLSRSVTVAVSLTQALEPVSNTETFNGLVTNPSDPTLANNVDSVVVSVPEAFVDLRMTASASPTTIYQEDSLFVSGTVSNLGPAIAYGVVVTADIPDGASVVSFEPSANCTLVASTLTCALGTVPIGDAVVTITMVTNVTAGVDTLATVFNATTTTLDPVASDNGAIASVAVIPSYADLSITLSDLVSPAVGGSQHQQVVAIFNGGNTAARDTRVDLTLDATVLTYNDAASAPECQAVVSPPPPPGLTMVTCWITQPLAKGGGAASLVIVSNVARDDAGTFETFGQVSTWVNELGYTDNNNDTLVSTVVQSSDTSVVLASSAETVYATRQFNALVSLSNAGPSYARDVAVSLELPSEVSFVSAALSPDAIAAGFVAVCDGTIAPHVNCTVSTSAPAPAYLLGGFDVNDAVTLTVTIHVDSKPGSGTLTLTATSTSMFEANLANNLATKVITVGDPFANLQIAAQGFPDNVPNEGGLWYFTTTVTNLGPFPADNVEMTLELPSCFKINVLPPAIAGSCVTAGDARSSVCDLGTVPVATPTTYVIEASVNCSLGTGLVFATANVTTTTDDLTADDDSASASTTVVAVNADLSVFITDVADPVLSGEYLQQVYTVFNTGSTTATGVVLTTTLDGNAIVNFLTSLNPAGCSYDSGANEVSCSVPDIPINGVESLTLSYSTSTEYEALFVTVANVSAATFEVDFTANSVSETTSLISRADIEVLMFSSATVVYESSTLITSVVISNNGPSPGVGTTLKVVLPTPDAVTLDSSALVSEYGTTNCSVVPGTDAPGSPARVLNCDVVDLPIGKSVTLGFTGTVLSGYVGGVTANATATGTRDVFADNNFAEVATTIGAPFVDIGLEIAASPAVITQESSTFVAITVSNRGPAIARGVVADLHAPLGVTLVSIDSVLCNLTSSTGSMHGGPLIDCVFGDLTVDSVSVGVAFSTDVPDGVSAIAFNSSMSLTTTDTNAADNTASAVVAVSPSSVDIVVFITDLSEPALGGSLFQQVFSMFNLGNTLATGNTLNVTYDASVVTFSEPTSLCTVHSAGELGCVVPDIAVDGVEAITVSWTTSVWAVPSVFSTYAQAWSGKLESAPLDNNATETTTLVQNADVAVTAGGFPDPTYANFKVTLSATVSNGGDSGARTSSLTMTVPPTLRWAGAGTMLPVAGYPAIACSQSSDLSVWTCNLGDVDVGATFDVQFEHTVASNATVGANLCSTATVSSVVPDDAPGNDVSTVCIPVGDPIVDLLVDIQGQPTEVPATVESTFRLFVSVSNRSPFFTATDPSVAVTLPAGVEVQTSGELPTNCTRGAGALFAGTVITCALDDMAKLTSESLQLTLRANIPAVSTVNIVADVSSSRTDPTPGNDQDIFALQAIPGYADLLVFINDFTDPASAGGAMAQAVTVFNQGIVEATSVVVDIDILPVFSSFPPSNPSACTLVSGNRVQCTIASLPANDAESFTLLYTLSAAATEGTYATYAEVSTATLEPDTTNNNATEPTFVERNADLTVFASSVPAQPSLVNILFPLKLLVVVSNAAGPNTAINPQFVSMLPNTTSLISITSDDPFLNCTESPVRTLTCNMTDIPVGIVITTEITVMVHAGGMMTHTVSVSSENDPVLSNNVDVWTANNVAFCQSDLSTTGFLSINPPIALAGENLTVTYLVTNRVGPKPGYNVRLGGELHPDMDVVPGGVITTDAADTTCAVTSGTAVRPVTWECTRTSPLSLRAEIEVQIPVVIDQSTLGGNWTLTAATSADTCEDPNDSNTEAVVAIEVLPLITSENGGALVKPSDNSFGFPWWLGLLIALLLFLCCFLVLLKLGFFKTKSKEDFEREAEENDSSSDSSSLDDNDILDDDAGAGGDDDDNAVALMEL